MTKIRNPNALKDWASEWLDTVTLDIFQKSQQNLDDFEVNFTGQLKKSGMFDLTEKLVKHITYNVDYAQDIEFGSDPKNVPIAPLKKWVRLKLRKDERIAYAVQEKIAREGIEGRFFLSASMTYIKDRYRTK